jgi:phosphohistidine phosphatase
VKGLGKLGVRFDRIYHSPWLRAVETADVLMQLVAEESVVTPRLVEPPDQSLLDELRGDQIAVVGHEPWLSQILAWLVIGDRESSDRVRLKKGGVALLEGELIGGGMSLIALYPPKVLRALGP